MMIPSDMDLLTLNAIEEAANQPDDGIAAVVLVALNRTALHYQSDGTIAGTILHPNAFSWTCWDMVGGKYTRVAFTMAEEIARIERKYGAAKQTQPKTWAKVTDIVRRVDNRTYSGPDFDKLTADTVLYVNPAISHPAWADPKNEVARIGAHTFYRA